MLAASNCSVRRDVRSDASDAHPNCGRGLPTPKCFGRQDRLHLIALFFSGFDFPEVSHPLLTALGMADLYNLSAHYWSGSVISLHALTITGDVFATIPINFLAGNNVNSWDYIINLANMLVDSEQNCPGAIQTGYGETVDPATVPSAGDYVYSQLGRRSHSATCFTLPYLQRRQLTRYHRIQHPHYLCSRAVLQKLVEDGHYRKPQLVRRLVTNSLQSHSAYEAYLPTSVPHNLLRSQTAFRTALLHRDYDCIITGDDEVDCESAHLVPKSREDVRLFVQK